MYICLPPKTRPTSKKRLFRSSLFHHSSITLLSPSSPLVAVDKPYPTVNNGSAILGTYPSPP